MTEIWRFALELLSPFVLTFILFLPWLPVAIAQISAQPNLSEPLPIDRMLRQILGFFAIGNTFELSASNMTFVVYFFLLFGLIPAAPRRRAGRHILLPAAWVVVSVALYLYLGLTDRYLRFLLPAQLAFALWLGRGVWIVWAWKTRVRGLPLGAIPKLAAAFALGAYLLTLFVGLDNLYFHPDIQRDDMRGLAGAIQRDLGHGDAVIVSAAGVEELLRYYYRGEAPVFGLPTTADEDTTRSQALDIIAAHDRLHVIFYGAAEQDPNRIVETTLNLNAFEIDDNWVDDLRYARYVSPLGLSKPTILNREFADQISLKAFALNTHLRSRRALSCKFNSSGRRKGRRAGVTRYSSSS